MDALPLTVSIPDYGRIVFDIAREASHEAAKNGIIPTIELGEKRKRVPVRVALRKLAGDDASVLEALAKDFLSKLKRKAA